ncbi:PqqD family protein [Anaerobranca gottschalkii]|uniref:Coenzyme PQQ synthesis protein D (PqqD) n=1 Tax=Anaerobranca gottschalkii DSM 13577 TaxID=1120990 RepID=A0A1I0CDK1_9FIRM|nr:PqqD family protein [Anaerobranca gottschalkii]SET17104.1 Coenzyme PQQ synthesis protein D (PqqD) [Anaerobranca gottschalkii DSM 13577]
MREAEIKFFTGIKPYLKFIGDEVYIKNEFSVIPMVTHPKRIMVFPRSSAQLIMVNSIGVEILDLCTGQNTVNDIFELLHEKYKDSVEPAVLFLDIIKFLRRAKFHKLVLTSL